jgi:MFS family permease
MRTAAGLEHAPKFTPGLRANLPQFLLLVLVNAFVGGMVGVQRTVVPLMGEREFHLASIAIATSFIVTFGLTKALANLVSGALADRWGRKPVLVLGWLIGLPVPFMLMWSPGFEWIVGANVLLGVQQGLAWSMTVVMKIDLVGPSRRGLALGLNEFAGYVAVGATAWGTGFIAAQYGLRPQPFYLAAGFAALGLVLSMFAVRETRDNSPSPHAAPRIPHTALPFLAVFARTSFHDPRLFACSQAGLVNNLNDGMAWGIFPLFFSAAGLPIERVGLIVALYPLSWGVCQIVTGWLSDFIGRRWLIGLGMWVQALGHVVIALLAGGALAAGIVGSLMLGIGTAMVYPTLLADVSDRSAPAWRARALSVYRFWRDLGYALGALGAGLIADALGMPWAIHAAGVLTAISGTVFLFASREARDGPVH